MELSRHYYILSISRISYIRNSINILQLNEIFLKPNHCLKMKKQNFSSSVTIVIKSTLKHIVKLSFPTRLIENVCVSEKFLNRKVKFVVYYLYTTTDHVFLLDYLNTHHISWNCANSDTIGYLLSPK